MRNLKKVLSLALALVMLLGMMVIGAGAATEFTDADQITNIDAAQIAEKLGIIEGSGGQFMPTTELTRAQAAQIIARMMLGKATADTLVSTKSDFDDLDGLWKGAAEAIAYCAGQHIVEGNGAGKFFPTNKVTGLQFAKMLLVALGNDAKLEGYEGAGWATNVAVDALNAGLNVGGVPLSNAVLTRDQAVQMVFNTLTANVVEYTSRGEGWGVRATMTNTRSDYRTLNAGVTGTAGAPVGNVSDGLMQFCELHFPNLKSVTTVDSYGHPAQVWVYGVNDQITRYAPAEPAYTYTSLQWSLASMGLTGYSLANGAVVYKNGWADPAAQITNIAQLPGLTGNGTKVEIYLSERYAGQIERVVVTETYLMQVDRISTVNNQVSLNRVTTSMGYPVNAVGSTSPLYAALSAKKSGDYVLVTALTSNGLTYNVAEVKDPTPVQGALLGVSKSGTTTVALNMTSSTTPYQLAAICNQATFDTLNASSVTAQKTATLYLDTYGYATHIVDFVNTQSTVFAAQVYQSVVNGRVVDMLHGIATDGSTIELNLGAANTQTVTIGNMYTYATATPAHAAVGATYTITAAAAATNLTADGVGTLAAGTITANEVTMKNTICTALNGAFYASNVKFIYVNDVQGNNSVFTLTAVQTGVQNVTVATTTKSYAVYESVPGMGRVITAVYIDGDPQVADPSAVAYVAGLSNVSSINGVNSYVYTVYFGADAVGNVASTQPGLAGQFVTYSATQDKDLLGNAAYNLSLYTANNRAVSVRVGETTSGSNIGAGTVTSTNLTSMRVIGARVVDLTVYVPGVLRIETPEALMTAAASTNLTFSVIYNNSTGSYANNLAYTIYVTGRGAARPGGAPGTVTGATNGGSIAGLTLKGLTASNYAPGVYQFSDTSTDVTDFTPASTLFFFFTKKNNTNATGTATLRIMKGGTQAYVESVTTATAAMGNGFFYIDKSSLSGAGTYTWTISGTNAETVTGTFTIN